MCQKPILIIVLGLMIGQRAWPQRSTMDLAKQGIDHIYNCDFQKSQTLINQIEATRENSAIPDLMKALQLFWRYYPIHFNEEKLELFHNYLEQAYDRSLDVLEHDPGNPEAIFLALASQGLLAESLSESGSSFRAVGAAKRAYNYVKEGAEMIDQFKEFYLSTGLYNYYREYYPEIHPIYRPFMSFFMKGDKQLGIHQLEIAAKEASISHVIAKYYLSYIYMRYEYLPAKALALGKDLKDTYPDNPLFSAIYLESLIINDKYREAAPIARQLQSNTNPYFRIYGDLFMGTIEERNRNYPLAEQLYRKSLELNKGNDMDRAHLEAYAYLGLGRIYQHKNDPSQARKYFKVSLDKAYTETMKQEAKSHLN